MRLPLFLLAALFVTPVQAQQADAIAPFGIGIRVNDFLSSIASVADGGGLSSGGATLLVPINVGPSFRIEPEIGFGRFTNSSSDGDISITFTQFRTGVGLMRLIPNGDYVLYAGGRLQYTRLTDSVEFSGGNDDEESQSVFGLGPVVGGEHYFSSRFSLGGEAGLFYRSYDSESDGEESNIDTSSINTVGSVFLRFYF
jgi:hypothetical protein